MLLEMVWIINLLGLTFMFVMKVNTAHHLPDVTGGLNFIGAIDCQQPSFTVNSKNTALIGLLLTIHHVSMNVDQAASQNVTTNGISQYVLGASANLRTKLNAFAS